MSAMHPGPVVLFGSGETSLSGGRVFEAVARRFPAGRHISILETPAGFELNSSRVAGRVADFLGGRLQNFKPEIELIPARKRGTAFSPDDPALLRPMLRADLIFLGPGSPTYAIRQLRGSRAWHTLLARHRLGAAVVFASAAAVAAGVRALPVYEIYKVGEDPHWRDGLDFFAAYGLSLVFIPHWNNAEGGAELDTSHCFMGQERFDLLYPLLPPGAAVVGIDEHTALVIDPAAARCEVMGQGGVTLLRADQQTRFEPGDTVALKAFGDYRLPEAEAGIPADVWDEVRTAHSQAGAPPSAPAEVLALVDQRQAARARRDWAAADALRQQVLDLGWSVLDTPDGPRLESI